MKTRSSSVLCVRAVLVVAALASGCGGDAPVPEQPTWVADVEPILRAHCFHCHGATAATMGRQRFDVFSLADYGDMRPGPGVAITSARDLATSLAAFTTTLDRNIRMPPPPALALTDRDLVVIERWAARPTRGERTDNRLPRADLLLPTVWIGEQLQVAILVRDEDRESVLGKVQIDGAPPADILRTGSQTLIIDAPPASVGKQITARLSDGWTTRAYQLGVVPARSPAVP